jgi:hypothetical protein
MAMWIGLNCSTIAASGELFVEAAGSLKGKEFLG